MENCTKFSHLILSKIIKIDPTSCQILRLICTKFDFGRPRWGSSQHSPRPVAELKVPTSKGRGGTGEGKGKRTGGRDSEGKGRAEGRGEEGKGGQDRIG